MTSTAGPAKPKHPPPVLWLPQLGYLAILMGTHLELYSGLLALGLFIYCAAVVLSPRLRGHKGLQTALMEVRQTRVRLKSRAPTAELTLLSQNTHSQPNCFRTLFRPNQVPCRLLAFRSLSILPAVPTSHSTCDPEPGPALCPLAARPPQLPIFMHHLLPLLSLLLPPPKARPGPAAPSVLAHHVPHRAAYLAFFTLAGVGTRPQAQHFTTCLWAMADARTYACRRMT